MLAKVSKKKLTRAERSAANKAAWANRARNAPARKTAAATETPAADVCDQLQMSAMQAAEYAVRETHQAYKASTAGSTASTKMWAEYRVAQKDLQKLRADHKWKLDQDVTRLSIDEQGRLLLKTLARLPPGLRLQMAQELAMIAGPELHEVNGDEAKGG